MLICITPPQSAQYQRGGRIVAAVAAIFPAKVALNSFADLRDGAVVVVVMAG